MSITGQILMMVSLIVIAVGIIGKTMNGDKPKKSKDGKSWWNKWEKDKKNFMFTHKGRKLWYSRSVAAALFAFAKDEANKLYILAEKRGKGCPDFQGHWCCPCGYLDFNETLEEAAVRECREETGIRIHDTDIKLAWLESYPNANKQNVTAMYMILMDEVLKPDSNINKFDLSGNEKDEVSDVRWVPFDDMDKYTWAFDHDKRIKEIAERFGLT